MTNAFEKQIHALYEHGETIRPEHGALLSPPCKSHLVTVVGGHEDFSYAVVEWLIEGVGVSAEQIVLASHLSAYPSLEADRFQNHFIGEFHEGDEGYAIRQQKYGGVLRLHSLGSWMTNFYTDDLQYQPVRGTSIAIIVLSEGINSSDRVISSEPIPNLDHDDPASREQYQKWEAQMEGRFLRAGIHDANAKMDLTRVQSELAALGVTTTTVVDSESWMAQQKWLRAFIEGHAHL